MRGVRSEMCAVHNTKLLLKYRFEATTLDFSELGTDVLSGGHDTLAHYTLDGVEWDNAACALGALHLKMDNASVVVAHGQTNDTWNSTNYRSKSFVCRAWCSLDYVTADSEP